MVGQIHVERLLGTPEGSGTPKLLAHLHLIGACRYLGGEGLGSLVGLKLLDCGGCGRRFLSDAIALLKNRHHFATRLDRQELEELPNRIGLANSADGIVGGGE